MKNARSFFGKYRRTQTQTKLAFLFLGTILCSIGGMIAIMINQFTEVIVVLEVAGKIDHETSEVIRDSLKGSSLFFVGIALTVAALSFVFGVRTTNRIFGPMVPIKRFIVKLKEGDYSRRVQLRKGDEFEDIAAELNELAARLESGRESKV